jgi:anti-sigma B factor antagonist
MRLFQGEGDAMATEDPQIRSPDPGWPLEIRTARAGDSVTIGISGEIDIGSADILKAVIRKAEQTDAARIVVDLSDLWFLDSSGLEVLFRANSRDRQDSGRLSFIPSKHEDVQKLLAITGLSEFLE